MGYSIQYRKPAEKYLDTQTTATKIRIMDAIDALPKGNITKLKGRDGYRLVVGSIRVVFEFTDETTSDGEKIIDIMLIGPRGDVYKK